MPIIKIVIAIVIIAALAASAAIQVCLKSEDKRAKFDQYVNDPARYIPHHEVDAVMQIATAERIDTPELTEISREAEPAEPPAPTPTVTPFPEPPATPTPLPVLDVDRELLKVVQLEAGYYDGYDSYLAIATVIFNRLEHGAWGDTLHAVLSSPHQFSVYGYRGEWHVDPDCYRACRDATMGKRYFPADVLYFRTVASYRQMQNKSAYTIVLTRWNTVFMKKTR
jgi:hypothetical protein